MQIADWQMRQLNTRLIHMKKKKCRRAVYFLRHTLLFHSTAHVEGCIGMPSCFAYSMLYSALCYWEGSVQAGDSGPPCDSRGQGKH